MALSFPTAPGLPAARRVCLLLLFIAAFCTPCIAHAEQHPDLLGLLALKASICTDSCKELVSWNASSNPCTWEGVYCGYVLGEWRAVSISLQLDAKSVLLNDSALTEPGGDVLQLPHVRELELLCMKNDKPIGEWLAGKSISYSLNSELLLSCAAVQSRLTAGGGSYSV
jgi:hypothetical protein